MNKVSTQCWCCSPCTGLPNKTNQLTKPLEVNPEPVLNPNQGQTAVQDSSSPSSSSFSSSSFAQTDSAQNAYLCFVCKESREMHTHHLDYNYQCCQYSTSNTMDELGKIMPSVGTESDETHCLFVKAFLHNNRLEHMVQVMGYHPHYLEAFLRTQQYMLRGDGPLPYDYRHFIAIMAAARHQCSYLVNVQTTEFLLQGGDERWLKGLDHIPQKLKNLYEINKLLAHRPWLINKSHIEKLTRGNDNWSISEIAHAIVLLTHFHSLCSFIYGCGINAELNLSSTTAYHHTCSSAPSSSDHSCISLDGQRPAFKQSLSTDACRNHHSSNSQQTMSAPHSPVSSCLSNSPQFLSSSQDGGGIEALMERMRKLTESHEEEMTQEELLKRFEKVENQSAELPAGSALPSLKADLLRYVDDSDYTYQDFAKMKAEIPTFRVQDYSWEDQGFSLANRLYAEIGSLLDDKFRVAYNLTYYTMGDNRDVDTSSFRRAIWNYIQCMFGIRHDDYDYSEVNQLLERCLKSYIKTVTCYPERITRKDYESFMREFKHSEKVHVNLMIFEARQQAELLYALKAIMKYMT